jgi:imidazolonepropionase-like amidohydrolase
LSFGCSEQQQTANTTSSASAPVVTDNPNDPDAIYVNGRIYTVADDQTWAEAIAIKDGKFVSVGSNEDVQALAGAGTELIDLEGSFAMPGVHDMHVTSSLEPTETNLPSLIAIASAQV